jgi:two-component system, OmpR family, response regulator ResD
MILIVDDNDDVRSVLAMLLEEEGYSVDEAVDGEAALERALDRDVSLIVLDVAMPRRNGPAFCRAYRERGGQAPIVLVTAAREEAVAVAMASCGAVDYLAKPFEIEQALDMIRRHAGRPS